VLATGTHASVPPIDGLAEALPWTSRDVTNLHQVPRRVVVIGGGVVACESVTWLHGLGAEQITVVEQSQRLLGRNEPFAGELVAEQPQGGHRRAARRARGVGAARGAARRRRRLRARRRGEADAVRRHVRDRGRGRRRRWPDTKQ